MGSGRTWCRPGQGGTVAAGLVEILEGLLLDGDRTFSHPGLGLSELGELAGLFHVTGRMLDPRRPAVPVLQCKVPDVTGSGAMPVKGLGLGDRGIKAKTHRSIVQRGTDKKGAV